MTQPHHVQHPPNGPSMKLVSLVHSSNQSLKVLAIGHVSSGIVVCKICSKHLFTEMSCWRKLTGGNWVQHQKHQKRSRRTHTANLGHVGSCQRSPGGLVATFSNSLLTNCGLHNGMPSTCTTWRSGGSVWSRRRSL